MADKVQNFKVCSPLKQRSGLTGNYHAICHYSYNLPLPAIMKTAIYILLSFLPCFVFGQDYPKIDTLTYSENISHVRYFIQYDGEKEMLLETYWFNEIGKHTITYSGYDGFELFKQTNKNNL